jgi:spore coat protein U-like protein
MLLWRDVCSSVPQRLFIKAIPKAMFTIGTDAKENNVKRSMKIVGTVAAAGIAFGALTSSAKAATASANLGVSATVTNNCTISTTALAFGPYDPVVANASTNLDGSGTVTVACTKGHSATIGLGLGSNAAGSVRRMKDAGTNFLTYELYNESTRTTVWTDAGGGLLGTGVAPSKAPRPFTVYGRVPSNQDIPAGNYSDTVVASVNF